MSPNLFILCEVATFVTLVAMWAGQSRLHWFWRGCILEGMLSLFLPVKAHEPLLFFLISTPLVAGGVAWLESRRPRQPLSPGDEAKPRPKVPRQFSLAEAFLLLALIGGVCGLGSAAVRAGVLMDWRALPVSALVFTSVAILCYRIGAFPGGLSHYWALALTGLIGGGVLLWFGIQSLQVILPAHGTTRMAIVSVWAWCLLLTGVCYFILRFGNPRHLIALAGLIFVAVRVERDSLQDWMYVGDLLKMYLPFMGRTADIVMLTVGYTLFSIGTILCAAIHHLAFSTSASLWKKYLARGAGLCAAAASVYWLGGVYITMMSTTPFPTVPVAEKGGSPLENALPLLDEFFALDDPPGFDPRNIPKAVKRHQAGQPIARVYSQLVQELQKPAWAPFDATRDAGPESRQAQDAILLKLRSISGVLTVDIDQAKKRKDYDGAMPFIMAQLQMEESLQHQGLVMHRAMDFSTLLRLGAIRKELSASGSRQVLADLRRMERTRELLDVTLQRERAWSERALNWRGRLRGFSSQDVPILIGGRSYYYPIRSLRLMDQSRQTVFRLLMTELALREFHEEQRRYPRELSELTPKYLEAVPLDPSSDQPLAYQPADEKYRLSSVWGKGEDLDAVIEMYRLAAAKAVAAAKTANGPPKTSGVQPRDDESATPEE